MGEATKFNCPHCAAECKVVRIEAPPTHSDPVLCLGCGGWLQNRKGKFALKYFRNGWIAIKAKVPKQPRAEPAPMTRDGLAGKAVRNMGGISFQNWIALALVVVALGLLIAWWLRE